MTTEADITGLLQRAAAGDGIAANQLFESVYPRLKRIAFARLHGPRHGEALDATSLVHECFLRLSRRGLIDVAERAAFFAYAGRVMRTVIVDHARAALALKRGGGAGFVTLTTGARPGRLQEQRMLLALDAALDDLEQLAPSYRILIEQRYFAGLSVAEIAELHGTSVRTIHREWQKALAFLRELLSESENSLLA